MARGTGNEILLSSNPQGKFLEGVIGDTSKPGTVMQIKLGVSIIGGRHTWVAYNPAADADPRLIAVLLPDQLQGKLATDAYVSGTRCFLYVPLAGEELNMLVLGQVGTGSANAFTVGERFIVQHGSGKLIMTSTSSQVAPFTCLEHIDLPADVDGLVWCMRN